MTDFVTPAAAPVAAPVTFGSVVSSLLSGLESDIFSMVLSVVTAFMPEFVKLTLADLNVIGNNFRLFLVAIGGGTPWGTALSDMLTGDWNAVSDNAKALAADFSETVATVLETAGLLPQGK